MSGAKKIRVESNERIDVDDFRFTANTPVTHRAELLSEFACDPARGRKWVLSGFDLSNPAGAQIQVTRGKAILATRYDGELQYGMLTTDGDASQIIDVSGYVNGTYGIYVRFDFNASDAEARVFWDPAGAGEEYIQTINTRQSPAWSTRIESSTPGSEWLKIGEVTVAAGAISSLDEKRPMFFEGDEGATTAFESGWSSDGGGSANDRNADRGAYGVSDLQMFTAATRQCLEDIKGRGLRKWYSRDIGGLNVGFDADPTEDRLNVGDADFGLALEDSGNDPTMRWDTDMKVYVQRDAGLRWWIWEQNGTEVMFVGEGDGGNGGCWPGAANTYDLGDPGFGWRDLYLTRNLELVNDVTSAIGDWSFGTHSGHRASSMWAEVLGVMGDVGNPAKIWIADADADTDAKYWELRCANDGGTGATLTLYTWNDAFGVAVIGMRFVREAGTGVDEIQMQGDLIPLDTDARLGTCYEEESTGRKNWESLSLGALAQHTFIDIESTASAADEENWRIDFYQGKLDIQMRDANDANPVTALDIQRDGQAVDYVRVFAPFGGSGFMLQGDSGVGTDYDQWKFIFGSADEGKLQLWSSGSSGIGDSLAVTFDRNGGDEFSFMDVNGGVRAAYLRADVASPGGLASTTTFTSDTGSTTAGAGDVLSGSNNNAGFIKIYVGTTIAYIPYWTSIA